MFWTVNSSTNFWPDGVNFLFELYGRTGASWIHSIMVLVQVCTVIATQDKLAVNSENAGTTPFLRQANSSK